MEKKGYRFTMTVLDQYENREGLDPQNMIGLVESFPQQCAEGEKIARETALSPLPDIHHVAVCGMGGSAIGGDLLRSYAAAQATASIEVVRNYDLPHYVGKNTLLVASSYSGNTEETLAAYQQAKQRGAHILGITTGGKLGELCQQDNYPVILVPGGSPPRAAVGYSFTTLLVAMERVGIIPDQSLAIASMLQTLQDQVQKNQFSVAAAQNPAKQLAQQLQHAIPVVYAGQDAFQPIATRWRCQFNENAKVFAHDMVVPEMNHNEILGWANPQTAIQQLHAIFLLDQGYHSQTQKRFQIMKQIIEPTAHGLAEVQSSGDGLLARMASLILFGDFVSVYLAYLYKEDPTPIKAIDFLKTELAK
jgi:glucose/mannose-6-phosphate isomerase